MQIFRSDQDEMLTLNFLGYLHTGFYLSRLFRKKMGLTAGEMKEYLQMLWSLPQK